MRGRDRNKGKYERERKRKYVGEKEEVFERQKERGSMKER